MPTEDSRDMYGGHQAPPHHGSQGSMYSGSHTDMHGRPPGGKQHCCVMF